MTPEGTAPEPACSPVCGEQAWPPRFRRLRDDGTIARLRREARQGKVDKVKRGDFGDLLRPHPALRGLRLGREAVRMAAGLIEAEVGTGPIFIDVVDDESRRRQFTTLVADRISRSPVRGIEGAYRDVMAARWDFLTDEARAKAVAEQKAKRPDRVARYLDLIKAMAAEPVFGADGHPVLAPGLSPEDEAELLDLTERVLGRLGELIRAFPPPDATRARVRGLAKLLDLELATSPGSGGGAHFPRAGAVTEKAVTEKARTGAANRSILRFPEDREAPLRALVGDVGQTRSQATHTSDADHAASVFSPNLALWAITNYSSPGDLVIDPFAGGGTRAVIAALAGRRYVGVDLRPDQAAQVNARLRALGLSDLAVVHAADAAAFDWPDALSGARAAAVLTCPPYFDLERYSDDPADLCNAGNYDAFCVALRRVVDALVPALAPGAASIWVAGEVRDAATGRVLRLPEDIRSIHEATGLDPYERSIAYARNQAPRAEGREAARGRVVPVHEEVVVTRYGAAPDARSRPAPREDREETPNGGHRIKVGPATLRLPFHGCELDYIAKVCKARCCEIDGRAARVLLADDAERARVRAAGGVVAPDGRLNPPGCTRCTLKTDANLCGAHGTDGKPFLCRTGPFHLHHQRDTLVLRNRYKKLKCFRDGTGHPGGVAPPAHVAFREALIDLFGEEQTRRIVAHVESGTDKPFWAWIDDTTYRRLRATATS